jgi:hypothetical protein
LVRVRTGAAPVSLAGGAVPIAGGMTTGGTVTAGGAALTLGVGVGVGAGRRDSGTSGATGPWRSDEDSCEEGSGGRRKSLTDGGAAASGAANAVAAIRARIVERISVAADMAGPAE